MVTHSVWYGNQGDFRERLYPPCYTSRVLPNRPDRTDIGDLGWSSLGYSFQEIAQAAPLNYAPV